MRNFLLCKNFELVTDLCFVFCLISFSMFNAFLFSKKLGRIFSKYFLLNISEAIQNTTNIRPNNVLDKNRNVEICDS